MYDSELDFSLENPEFYNQSYLATYKKYQLIKNYIPNHYFFLYILLAKSFNAKNVIESRVFQKVYLSNVYSNAQIDYENKCLKWDWPILQSSGTITYSSETFSVNKALESYNYFTIKGILRNKPFEILDFFIEIDLEKMTMVRIREYKDNENEDKIPTQLQYTSPILLEDEVIHTLSYTQLKLMKQKNLNYDEYAMKNPVKNTLYPTFNSNAFFQNTLGIVIDFQFTYSYGVFQFYFDPKKSENPIAIALKMDLVKNNICNKQFIWTEDDEFNNIKLFIETLITHTPQNLSLFCINSDFHRVALRIISICHKILEKEDFQITNIIFFNGKISQFSLNIKTNEKKKTLIFPKKNIFKKRITISNFKRLLNQEPKNFFPYKLKNTENTENTFEYKHYPSIIEKSKFNKDEITIPINHWFGLLLYFHDYIKSNFNIPIQSATSLPQIVNMIWQSHYVKRGLHFQNETPFFYNILTKVNPAPLIISLKTDIIIKNKKYYEYDINKFYTYLNLTKLFPTLVIDYKKSFKAVPFDELFKKYNFFGFAECEIRIPDELMKVDFPYIKSNSNKINKWLFSEEMIYAQQLGYDISVKDQLICSNYDILKKSTSSKSKDIEPINTYYKELEKKALLPDLDWFFSSQNVNFNDPVSEYTHNIYIKFEKASLNTEKKLFKDLINLLPGLLVSIKKLTKNFVDYYSNNPEWSIYHRNHLIDDLGIFSYKKPHAIHMPLKVQSARYLALIAYGRMHIHKLYHDNNLDVIYLNTDGFISTKPLPSHLLGEKLGELRFNKEVIF